MMRILGDLPLQEQTFVWPLGQTSVTEAGPPVYFGPASQDYVFTKTLES